MTDPEVSLRRSRPEDREALFAIWESAVRETHDFVSEADLAMYADLLRERYLPANIVTVALRDTVPVGFVGVRDNRIEALFVHAGAHRQGIGRRLVEQCLRRRTVLHVDVNEQNEGARRFYEQLGFRPIGRSRLDGCGRPYPILHLVRS